MSETEGRESIIIDAVERIRLRQEHHPATLWVTATGKPELFIRDHLGAEIAANNPELTVAREWRKHDLAVLNSEMEPLIIVEGKHLFDFDLLQPAIRKKYRKSVSADCEKMQKRSTAAPLIFLLMTSIRNEIPDSLERVTKYSPGINKALRKHGSELMNVAITEARDFLADFGTIIHETELVAGRTMGLDVHLWMWLARADEPLGVRRAPAAGARSGDGD